MKKLSVIILAGLLLPLVSCRHNSIPATPALVPVPVSLEMHSGHFTIDKKTVIQIAPGAEMASEVGAYLSDWLKKVTAFDVPVSPGNGGKNSIILEIEPGLGLELGEEGYKFASSGKNIRITAASANGIFYGVQTLFQLLPPEVYTGQHQEGVNWVVPACQITDYPHYGWRGMHLDVSRHFFPKEFIKKYLDLLAMHKMNTFHWHLTDDNGWRIEIKKYPLLTDISAWRVDREDQPWRDRELQKPGEEATYGGFYTQDDIREIVRYAADRMITIIPEIEMPGHSYEVFAAYPEYSCKEKKLTVLPGSYWPNSDIYCAGKDETFQFIDDILTEVAALFPSEYIHIGGDEADKTNWKSCPRCQKRIKEEGLANEEELQSYFVQRVEKILQSKGKKLIGWDEILEGGLAPEATVMSWRGFDGGIASARQGHDVIMCPTSHCYFDYYQGDPETEPEAIGGYITLKKVYSFRPTPPVLTDEEAKHILGAQGNVWTEFIPTPEQAEYMAIPRMTALAEVVWSPDTLLDWERFKDRLVKQFERLDAMNVNYCEGSFKVTAMPVFDKGGENYRIALEAEAPGASIHYTTTGDEPTVSSEAYASPIAMDRDVELKALAFKDGQAKGKVVDIPVSIHKAIGKKFFLANEPSFKYKGDNDYALLDGLHGSTFHSDGKWLGFNGDDLDIIIDLGDTTKISSFQLSFLHDQRKWIFLPKSVEIYSSLDGKQYTIVTHKTTEFDDQSPDAVVYPVEFETAGPIEARFIRVWARNRGVCPDWHPGAGGSAWIFADEIEIQ